MDNNIVLFCKSYLGDLDRLKILKNSIDKFNKDKIPFYISVPQKDLKFIKSKIENGKEEYKLNFISDEEILNQDKYKDSEQNWNNQQIIKLEFHKLNLCNFYVVLDSDCYFITDFRISDFMYSQDIPYFFEKQIDSVGQIEQVKKIKEFFGRNGEYYSYIFVSQVFSVEVLKSMKNEILEQRNWTWQNLLDICPYEFNWYGEYFVKYSNGNFKKRKENALIFWFQRQYRDAKLKGYSEQDFIEQGYILLCLNNGWVVDKKFKPILFHRQIKFVREFVDTLYDNIYDRNNKTLIKAIKRTITSVLKINEKEVG